MVNIKEVLRSFQVWQAGNIKRGGNGAAHMLAKFGVQHGSNRILLNCFPDCIRELVSSESSTLFM